MSNIQESPAYRINVITLPLAIAGCCVAAAAIFLLYPSEISIRLGTGCFALAAFFGALHKWVMPKIRTFKQLDVLVFCYHAGIHSLQWLSLTLTPETESPGGALLISAFGGLMFHSSYMLAAAIIFCGTSWLAIRNYLGVPPTPSLILEFFVVAPVFAIIMRLAVRKTHDALSESQSREVSNINELQLTAARLARETQLRRESELKLLHAQKNESLGILAAGVAHDFNNSLLAISAFAENIQLTSEDETIKDAATQIVNAVEQASRICGQMLTYAGKSTGELQRMGLCKLVTDAQPLLQATVGPAIPINVTCLPAEGAITGNETQVQQILMNLVKNAAEAMGESGSININVTKVGFDNNNPDDIPEDYVGSPIGPGKYVQLDVVDSGPGMPEDVVSQVFDPYFTTKQSGHGFGLSTVLGIVRSHKATMTIMSKPNQGTTMRILFPAVGMKFADSGQFRTPLGPKIVGKSSRSEIENTPFKKILVIDDDELVRTPLSRMLGLMGWEVVDVESGQKAIEVLRQGEQFFVLLVDFKMPLLNGQQTLKAIRELGCETPAILCSGFIAEPEQASVLADFDSFLPKPFHRRDLEEKIAALQIDADRIL